MSTGMHLAFRRAAGSAITKDDALIMKGWEHLNPLMGSRSEE